jgi:cell division septum initiation protein DivIVA
LFIVFKIALNIQRDYDEMARKKAVMERKMRKEMENVCEQLKEVSIKFLTRSTTATKPDDQQQKIEEAHEEVTRIAEIEQLVDTTKTSIEALREEFARLST